MNVTLLVVLGVVNIPLYIFIGKLFFSDWDDFGEAIRFWFTPDLWSAFRGEYWEDWLAELKLGLFLVACGGCVYGEYVLIHKLFMS